MTSNGKASCQNHEDPKMQQVLRLLSRFEFFMQFCKSKFNCVQDTTMLQRNSIVFDISTLYVLVVYIYTMKKY